MRLFGGADGRAGLGWLLGLVLATIALIAFIFLLLLVQRCGGPPPTVAQATATMTVAPTNTATLAATATVLPSSTTTPIPPPSATSTPLPTETVPPTFTPEPTITLEPTSAPTEKPTIRPTNTPCSFPVDPAFARARAIAQLGCPTGSAEVIWAAAQAFERGYMLWRNDLNQVTVFYEDGRQDTFVDQWQGQRYIISKPPSGLVAPVRGFGWLWQSNPEIAKALGWGTEEEKGFCAQIQYFVGGFALRSVTGSCGQEFNRANERDFRPLFFIVDYKGRWTR